MQMVGAKSVAQDEIYEKFKIEIFSNQTSILCKETALFTESSLLRKKSAKFG
jgi:hypothetical protein